MSKVTLYLHIGATKTGTTALQRFLEQNFSTLLNDFGVLYPNFHDEEIHSPMPPGHNYWQGYHFENFDSSHDLEVFNRCIQYCKKNSLKSIVISHEALLVNWYDRIGLLAGKLDADIKIICYVRRQDHHLESAWKQWGHKFVSSSDLLDSLDKHEEWGGWRQTNWYKLIAPWAHYFGRENIIIRPYEKEQLPDGIFPDFLNIINVNWPQRPVLERDVNVNAGFSRDVLEFLYLNKDFYESFTDQRLHNMLNQLLDDDVRKKPFETYGILSPGDRIKLLNRYEESNQKLAREYLNRSDGRLFNEPWPNANDAWVPYEGLNVARLTPIITKMIYKLYARQNAIYQQQTALYRTSNTKKIKRWLSSLKKNITDRLHAGSGNVTDDPKE
jgi:hypothetical protein